MTKKSIKSIAEEVGVSKTTVSFVLNGHGDERNISKLTQEKILKCAELHNYQLNMAARSLRVGRSYTIGFIVPDISNPFFGRIVRLVEDEAEKKGYSVMISSSDENSEKELKIIEQFRARQIDGIILAPTTKFDKMISVVNQSSIPIVFFDRIFKDQINSFVAIDNKKATYKITEMLLKKGHKRIALLSLLSHLPNMEERITGYQEALKDHGIVVDEELITDIDYHNKKSGIKSAIRKYIEREEPITAFVFLNNMLTAEGVWTVNKYHKDVLGKIEFGSFDNLDLFDFVRPKIISIVQPAEEIAKNCVNMLCEQIDSKKLKSGIKLSTSFVMR